jgi:hypothetical protein
MTHEKALALLNGHIEILEPIASDKSYISRGQAARHLSAARLALSTLRGNLDVSDYCLGIWGANGRAPAIQAIAHSYHYLQERKAS